MEELEIEQTFSKCASFPVFVVALQNYLKALLKTEEVLYEYAKAKSECKFLETAKKDYDIVHQEEQDALKRRIQAETKFEEDHKELSKNVRSAKRAQKRALSELEILREKLINEAKEQ